MGRQKRTVAENEGRGPTEYLGVASTGTTFVSIPSYGLSLISTAANTYCLDAPVPGVRKVLFSTGVSSAARVVKLHPVSSGDSITAGLTTAGAALTEISFNSTDHMLVELIGLTSVKWQVLQATTFTGGTNVSTGIIFQTS